MNHPPLEELQGVSRGTLPPVRLREVLDHISVCEECSLASAAERGNPAREWSAALRSPLLEGHLCEAEIADLVDGKLAAEAVTHANQHLRECASCEAEVRDLQHFRRSLPVEQPEFTPPIAAQKPRDSFWRQWFGLPGWGMATAGALAAGGVVWVSTQQLRNDARRDTAQVKALRSQLETYAARDRDLTGRTEDLQRFARSQAAMESALQQANQREEALRRRLMALNGGRPEIVGPPAPVKARKQSSMGPPEILASVIDRKARLMGDGNSGSGVRLVSPVGTYLRDTRPTFIWNAVQDAVSYDLTIYTAQLQQVVRETGITEPVRVLGSELPRGKVYRWEVSAFVEGREIAHGPGPSDAAALFGILSEKQIQALDKATAESRISRAANLAQGGLLDEADSELEALLKAVPDPEVSRRARSLQNQIRGWRK